MADGGQLVSSIWKTEGGCLLEELLGFPAHSNDVSQLNYSFS
jgi:hypothetical protein